MASLFPKPISNGAMDAAATLIAYERPVYEIREELIARGLTDHEAYLAYKAALLLWKSGFYEILQQPVIRLR